MNTTNLPADATTLSAYNIKSRTILLFKVDEAYMGNVLPVGWKSSPISDPNHPAVGANLLIIFSDRQIVQTADNGLVNGNAINQLVIAVVEAEHPGTDEKGVIIAYGLSAKPEGAPGPYGVYSLAKDSNVERVFASTPYEAKKGKEIWNFTGENGEQFYLNLNYESAVPNRSNSTTRAYSSKDPVFYRIYIADQGVVPLRSIPHGIDKISNLEFKVQVPQLNIELDISKLVSVLS